MHIMCVHSMMLLLRALLQLAPAFSLAFSPGSPRPRVHGGGECTSDEGCQLNGRCSPEHKCLCVDAWEGAHCELLATRPTAGAAHAIANASSWGGRAIFDPADGLYHGFFSEFGGTCGMNMWDNHSTIVHMTSESAAPASSAGYRRRGVAIPAFSHCVDTVRLG